MDLSASEGQSRVVCMNEEEACLTWNMMAGGGRRRLSSRVEGEVSDHVMTCHGGVVWWHWGKASMRRAQVEVARGESRARPRRELRSDGEICDGDASDRIDAVGRCREAGRVGAKRQCLVSGLAGDCAVGQRPGL